ncbi:TlyA family RNA methyltransferase [Fictibacillus barbaricus]|uniref:23S rRNA (Cytidine1920-2'-O)/16S rRNA (Cytidine1409-2'-O)-methyltransferase n=1 Tax=Fictibacillus barbaricus TaxID=182136 RepID=A0ABU1TZP1_9BACL|nr:TlyA family RNA methyltransferase [Fictibacillus barbaricus]MDR7072675.1 23S rRNA (cytidine1920-2'-O)/16S rRNA (cytidine1409-2'-O)-methyltransferase [Fictibacillus barbaricus]
MKKERVDVLLVNRGLCETREKAKRSVMAGLVFSGTSRLDKPGEKIELDAPLHVKGDLIPYVGRGGLKLEKALKVFSFDVKDKIGMDIGASTGGFTDCALQNGASYIYAIDVGYNQLAWKLRNDSRVAVMERTNFRYVTPDQLENGTPEFATIDVSFISLRIILPVLTQLMGKGEVIALIKPQFEAGREEVGKKGIVRDEKVHERVILEIVEYAKINGINPVDLSFSPITGGDGNIEFLLHGEVNKTERTAITDEKITQVVREAHDTFKKERG